MIDTYKTGQVVELGDGRPATVQFVGQTSFADGDWVGVLLEEPTGKNDGSVKGVRYFDCEPNHGMFLRPTAIAHILEEPTPKPPPQKKTAANGKPTGGPTSAAPKSRPSSIANGIKRPSQDLTANKRQSINAASPSPAPRPSLAGRKSPTKLATRTVGPSATSNASSRGATPPTAAARRPTATGPAARPSATSRPSIGGARAPNATTLAATRPTRPSISGPGAAGTRTTTAGPGQRPAPGAARQTSRSSLAPTSRAANGAARPPAPAKPAKPVEGEQEAQDQSSDESESHPSPTSSDVGQDGPNGNYAPPTPQPAERPPEQSPTREDTRKGFPLSAATSRHIQDLETQINVHKKQSEEYREQLTAMDKLRTEKDRYQAIIEKLQSKLQPQSQELADLKGRLKESEKKLEELQNTDGDHETELEMATLDREMAEEHAEAARLELEALKEKMAELQDEVEVLREENNLMGEEVSPEERSSQGWMQLERSNERLKEALIRLCEITQDKEAELTAQVSSLEDDLKQFSTINEQYEDTREKLKQSEAAVENLKEQLDEAMDAENTTERLTADNMALQDQIEGLRNDIRELEDLQELNEELEYNHVEAEKQMQEELDFKESLIGDQKRLVGEQSEKMIDYEYTINKFRELVTNLQSGLEDMKASQQITEAEAEELNSRSKAMNDLNLKLQSSAEKAQMNIIDLETRRLEAQEAVEHLAIVQMFLPDSFKAERESVLAYLRFRRVAAKSRLLHSLLKNKTSGDGHGSSAENVFVLCDILDKLVWIAAMCDRFVSRISTCSIDDFAKYESALYELDPVERGLNVYIDNVKRGEFKEDTAADELQRTTSVLRHLAEVHINNDNLANYAEDVLMRTSLMQSYLENTATALSYARTTAVPNDLSDEDHDPEDSLQQFNTEAQSLISQTRSAKVVATKAHQALTDLKTRSMSLEQSTSTTLADAEDSASTLAHLARQLGSHLRAAINNTDLDTSDTDPASHRDTIRTALRTFTTTLPDTSSSLPLPPLSQKLKTTTSLLTSLLDGATTLTSVSEFQTREPPWSQRAAALRAAKQTTQDTETELLRLRDTLSAQSQQLRTKDMSLEENAVKIELLESRTRDAAEKAGRIAELSASLDDVRKREREMLKKTEGHTAEVATLRAEKDHWRSLAESHKDPSDDEDGSVPPTPRGERSAMSSREVDALRAEVDSLSSAVRFLSEESRKARLSRPDEPHMSWLSQPLYKSRTKTSAFTEQMRQLKGRERDCMNALRSVVDGAGVVDLRLRRENGDGKGRLGWRPMKEKSAWKVARQREEWVSWRTLCLGVSRDAEDFHWAPAAALRVSEHNGKIAVPSNGHAAKPRADSRTPTKREGSGSPTKLRDGSRSPTKRWFDAGAGMSPTKRSFDGGRSPTKVSFDSSALGTVDEGTADLVGVAQ